MIFLRANDAITRALMILAASWAFILCFFILADIIFRALNMPLQGTKEIVANSVVMIVFLQVSFAIRSRSMLNADFLVVFFPKGVQKALVVFGLLLGAAFFFFLLKAGIKPAVRSFVNGEFDGEGALRVPVWPARWTILLGSGLAGVQYLILCVIEIFDLHSDRMEI